MKRHFLPTFTLVLSTVLVFGQGNVPNGATSPASAIPQPAAKFVNSSSDVSPFYLRTSSPKMPLQDSSKIARGSGVDSILISTQYSDAMGRPLESIAKQSSPSRKDIVSFSVYDEFNHQSTQYLSFAEQSNNTNDGLFKSQPIADDSAFYKALLPNEQIYYGQASYDGSPLERAVKTMAPGNSWTGSGVGVSSTSRANNAADSVHLWTIPISSENDLAITNTFYQPGSLQVQQTTDERGVLQLVYVDELGRKVLTKSQAVPSPGTGHVGWLCTYYVYDEMNHLRMILPPKAVLALNTVTMNWSLATDATISNNLCYSYFYDSRGRVTMKRIPGKGKTYLVYDITDRPVFVQDSALRNGNQWLGTLYDGQSRPVISGILNYAPTWSQLQQLVTTQTSNGTTGMISTDSVDVANLTLNSDPTTGDYRATQSITLDSGFTAPGASSFSGTIDSGSAAINSLVLTGSPLPAGAQFNILTVAYYDDYTWMGAISGTTLDGSLTPDNINSANFNLSYNSAPDYAQPIVSSHRTRGAMTGMKQVILNTSNFLYSVIIFDDHGRPIQVKQTNNTGGTDVATTQYGFLGAALRVHVAHQKGGANPQNHTVLTKVSYDHIGRVLSIAKSLDNAGLKTVSQNTYNELGQVQQRVFGNNIETQNYTYNMRGWLLGINNNYVNTAGSTANYFGENLSYDYGFSNSQVNGNIAGVVWKAGGDGLARAFGYSYDSVNRLTQANFAQQNSGSSSWTRDMVDYTVSGLSYDAGGNILGMMQKGLVYGKPATVDSLTYQYFGNSNLLQKVSDASPVTSPLGDFKDSTNTGDDYTYDANGNTTRDYNRHMITSTGGSGAVYNFLNKPDSIVLNGKAGIHYIYDATGAQLAKQVNDYTSGKTISKTWQYIGGFVYYNDTLQYVLYEEGQIRNAKKINSSTGAIYYAFEYDYFIKDHQGNVRTVLTEGSDTATYAATMESKDSAVVAATFSNVYSPVNTVWPKPSGFDTDTSNHNVAMLNPETGPSVGPSIVLKVMRGDQVQISTYSFYNSAVQSPQPGISLLNSILSVLGTSVIGVNSHLTAGDLTGVNNALNPNVTQFLNNGRSYDNTRPKAYLNWILFDDQFNYVASNSGVAQVTAGSTKQVLSAPTQSIGKNGYLYVYVSNESQQNVYFDNLTVKQMTGPLQQEQSYYPFGLPMAGISDKAMLKSNTPYKANGGTELEEDYGLQYYNTLFRKYDPQIGRFNGIDAMNESTAGISPYHFAGNNPVLGTDPTGLEIDIRRLTGDYPHLTGGGENEIDQQFDELDQFDAETGIGGVGLSSGQDGQFVTGDALFQNQMTLQRASITPDLAQYTPGIPYIYGPGVWGVAGTNKYGGSVLRVRQDMTMDDDAFDFFPEEWLGTLHLSEQIIRIGGGAGGFGGGYSGGYGGFMFEGNDESRPFFGNTATNKFSKDLELFSTGLGDKLIHRIYNGTVSGTEGSIYTIDEATNNKEFEGQSINFGPISIGYGTDFSLTIGFNFKDGTEWHMGAGVGTGFGQLTFGHSKTIKGEIGGAEYTYTSGLGTAVLLPAVITAAGGLMIAF